MAEVNKEAFKSSPYQVSTDITQPKELKNREKQERQRREEEEEPLVKKSLGSKIAERFLAIDRDDIRKHLIYDWLFPEIIDMVSNLLNQLFFGNDQAGHMSSSRARSSGNSHVPYDQKFKQKGRDKDNGPKIYILDSDFRHIRLECERKAPLFKVLDSLREEIQQSDAGIVFVKDLFNHEYINAVTNYKMGEWGWEDLENNVDLIAKGGQWELVLPPANNYARRKG